MMVLAQTHNGMGQYAATKRLLDQSHRMVRQTSAGLMEFKNIYREYAVASVGLGNYKAALSWVNEHANLEDSLLNTGAKELLQQYELNIKQAEARQNLAEKQRQIERLENQQARQKLWLGLAGVSAVVALLVVGFLYYRQKQKANAIALRAMQREQALLALQAELQG